MTWVACGAILGVVFMLVWMFFIDRGSDKNKKLLFRLLPLCATGLMYMVANIVLIHHERHSMGQPVVLTDLTDGTFTVKGQVEIWGAQKGSKIALGLLPTAGRRFETYPDKIFFVEVMPKKGEVFVVGEILEKKGNALLHTSPPPPLFTTRKHTRVSEKD